jgi:hypothetical protein
MTDPVNAIGITLQATSALDALGVMHTIGGSIASSMAGEPRSTIDVDVIADLKDAQVIALMAGAGDAAEVAARALASQRRKAAD